MPTLSRRSVVVLSTAVAIGVGVLVAFRGWPLPAWTLELSGLMLAAILTAAPAMEHSTAKDWATMPPSFVVVFASLLAVQRDARRSRRDGFRKADGLTAPQPLLRTLVNAATVLVVIEAAARTPGTRGTLANSRGGAGSNRGRKSGLLRQVRLRGRHRAALHETTIQSIVAEESSSRCSELLPRRQSRRGTR